MPETTSDATECESLATPPTEDALTTAMRDITEEAVASDSILQPGAAFALGCLALAVEAQPGCMPEHVAAAFRGAVVSPDNAHTETVTEWRAFGTDLKTGEQHESDAYSEPDRARVKARRWSAQLGYVAVRVESRTVTTSRRESEWKATDQ